MPLQSVPDLFDDATHRQLDAAVNKDMYTGDEMIVLGRSRVFTFWSPSFFVPTMSFPII